MTTILEKFPSDYLFFKNEDVLIYNSDAAEILKKFPSDSVDFIFTSPPYLNITYKYCANVNVPKTIEEYLDFILPITKELLRVLKPTGSFILNLGDVVINKERTLYPFEVCLRMKEQGWKLWELLIWDKMKFLPNPKRFGLKHEYLFIFAKDINMMYYDIDEMRTEYSETSLKRYKYKLIKRYARSVNEDETQYKLVEPNLKGALPSTIVRISSEVKRVSDLHVAVFPENLVSYFMRGFTKENMIVLDPFCGTGTTLKVAKELNRKSIGIDIVKEYCEVSKNRII